MTDAETCPVCNNRVAVRLDQPPGMDATTVLCLTCGMFRISRTLQGMIESSYGDRRWIISAIIRSHPSNHGLMWVQDIIDAKPAFIGGGMVSTTLKHQVDQWVETNITEPFELHTGNIDDLLKTAPVPKDPLDSIDRCLILISENTTSPAEYIELPPFRSYPLLFCRDADQFQWILSKLINLGWLESDSSDISKGKVRLTIEGWKQARELRKTGADPNQAFVAMWFDKGLEDAFDLGIQPALEELGYNPPFRIDRLEHNDKIDDRIIAEIRHSALLIADFTGNRGGVYLEAGFAQGLGIPVIWTCKNEEEHISKLHFDTRQYNHILWDTPEDLKQRLKARIEATIPGRPRVQVKDVI
jgi:hypothetical protein